MFLVDYGMSVADLYVYTSILPFLKEELSTNPEVFYPHLLRWINHLNTLFKVEILGPKNPQVSHEKLERFR